MLEWSCDPFLANEMREGSMEEGGAGGGSFWAKIVEEIDGLTGSLMHCWWDWKHDVASLFFFSL